MNQTTKIRAALLTTYAQAVAFLRGEWRFCQADSSDDYFKS